MTLVERRTDGRVAVITLNRPEALNAISSEVAAELGAAFRAVALENDVWVVVLAAAGDRAFCVGADLKERGAMDDAGWLRNRAAMRGMFDALRAIPQPAIAAAFGYALGGGFELILGCDLVVAAEDSIFGLPEARVGILPGGFGTQLLPRKIGVARAKELILTGRRIHAVEAFDMGLVARVEPRERLDAAALELAADVCRSSPVAVREAKRAIDRGIEVPLEQGVEIEDVAWRRSVASEDRREGIAAFNEKREPTWSNR